MEGRKMAGEWGQANEQSIRLPPFVCHFSACLCLCLIAAPVLAQDPKPGSSALEREVKAAYLFNFAKYVEWPPAAFPDAGAPIMIGVLGRDPFGELLEQTIAGRSIGKRKVLVQRSERIRDLKNSHILFVSSSERERLSRLPAELKGSWALTVGEMPRFLEYGMVHFVIDNAVVRFDVNLDNAQRAGLKISARMLASARKVWSAGSAPR
jgi:hypothetical protein